MNQTIRLIKGDITVADADAIVNAANSTLLGGGGVDGAIHRAAGPQLLEFCHTLKGCPTGEAKISPGFDLKAKWVIHTVGPRWRGGRQNEAELLKKCYINTMKLAVENKCQSIVFPCVSTGVYNYPKEKAAQIAVDALKNFLKSHQLKIAITICVFEDENFRIYEQILQNN